MNKNKLSHSSVSLYQQCSYCYYLKYIENIRPVKTKSALLFGAALDNAFNILLLEKDLDKAISIFKDEWKKVEDIPVEYRKNEVDIELLNHYCNSPVDPKDPSLAWKTLYHKGLLFIETYYNEVLPKIKEVVSVQERFSFENADGDEIYGLIDLIVRWEDGKLYLLDNKTSSFKYSKDDAKNSPQLSLYHYVINEKYKLDGIGFIILSKNINKNRKKICQICKTGCATQHKTCPGWYDTPVMNGEDIKVVSKRCGGEFTVSINPTVDIEYIFDTIDPDVQDQVIDKFDNANHGICNGVFSKEHNSAFGRFGPCDYYRYYPGSSDFYKKERNNEKK